MTNDPVYAAKRAKIKAIELARLLHVHRVTTGAWYAGTKRPLAFIAAKVAKLMAAIDEAVAEGDLPMPGSMRSEARAAHLEQTIVKHLTRKLAAQRALEET